MATYPEAWNDLTRTERDVLVTLATLEPATGNAVAEQLPYDRSTVGRNIRALRAGGYVIGEKDTNTRGHPVANELTDSARVLLREVGKVWDSVEP